MTDVDDEDERELEVYHVIAHPNRREFAKGYALGLEHNSEWPFVRYEAYLNQDCPLDSLYVQRAGDLAAFKGWVGIA